jgi:hypothetical protein
VAPQLISFPSFRGEFFDKLLGFVLGPISTILLFAAPISSSDDGDRSSPMDLASWESWLLFLLLVCVHAFSSSSSTAAQKKDATILALVKGLVLCTGIACFYARRAAAAAATAAAGAKHASSDFYFFRSFALRLAATTSPAIAKYFVQSILLAWLALLSCRWFSEVMQLIFFVECCEKHRKSQEREIMMCPRCYCASSMKEDVDDACSSLAVAGILLGAYAISSRPLPETMMNEGNKQQQQQQHYIAMLMAFGVLAAVMAGIYMVHAVVKYAICSESEQREQQHGVVAAVEGIVVTTEKSDLFNK